MQAANSFNIVTKNEHIDKYKLLSFFWQEMDPYMKNTSMDIANNQGNAWDIDLPSQLEAMFNLTNADVVSFQPCIFFEMQEPSHLDQVLEGVTIEEETEDKQDMEEVEDVDKNQNQPNNYLTMFMSNPPYLKGAEVLDHQTSRCQSVYEDYG